MPDTLYQAHTQPDAEHSSVTAEDNNAICESFQLIHLLPVILPNIGSIIYEVYVYLNSISSIGKKLDGTYAFCSTCS